jgi:hypothetical protein
MRCDGSWPRWIQDCTDGSQIRHYLPASEKKQWLPAAIPFPIILRIARGLYNHRMVDSDALCCKRSNITKPSLGR